MAHGRAQLASGRGIQPVGRAAVPARPVIAAAAVLAAIALNAALAE
jgi:hypothetical protein